MRKAAFCLVVFLLLQLPDWLTTPNQESISAQVVRSISVTCQGDNGNFQRYYDTGPKMQKLLLYIRNLGPLFSPTLDPESLAENNIQIILHCADGSQKTYQQKGDLYFRSGTEPWRQMRRDKGTRLLQLLLETPSDPG